MWDDTRQLNAVAAGFAIVAACLLAWGVLSWAARQPVFAIREVVVAPPIERASAAHIERVIREELAGTLLTIDLAQARAALSRVPWVRNVSLRRRIPARLDIEIEEHTPLARWNDTGLVNSNGEVFVADYDGDLPQFDGQDGHSAEITARFREWSALVAPLGLSVQQVAQSARGGWHVRAAGGSTPLDIELGRDEPSERLAAFAAAYRVTVGALMRAGTRVVRVDLRYRNGFAARVPGLPELTKKAAG